MDLFHNRVAGVLLGLAAGDRIGGPVRMAVRVAESLLECGGFDAGDIGRRYLEWWRDDAFDTGPTAAAVLSLVDSGMSFEEAARQVDQRANGMTAGCNPAHRSVPLAMFAGIPEPHLPGILDASVSEPCDAAPAPLSRLASAAQTEAKLTHSHPLAGDVAAAIVCMCRELIIGMPWADAIEHAAIGRRPETIQSLKFPRIEQSSQDGFAPNVLSAAIHFAQTSRSFPEAIERSIAFAGLANYSPVLVGSLAGARWGYSQIDKSLLEIHAGLLPRLHHAANKLAAAWA